MSPLFNRNDKTTIAELEEYYANQRTNDGPLRAWAMAILSLLITIAVILALFFAGRWLWRTITTNNDTQTPIATETGGIIVREDGSLSGNLSSLNPNTVTVDAGNTGSVGVVTDEAASTEISSNNDNTLTVTATDESATTASITTGTTAELPNTGAGTLLATAPIVAAAVGYAISRRRILNR